MSRWRPAASSWRVAFIAAAVAWAALLAVAPYLASRAHASTPASALLLGVYSIGSLVCHQLPERSYRLWGAQMPVCARCAGIYFGAALSALGAWPFRAVGARAFHALGARPFQAREARRFQSLGARPVRALGARAFQSSSNGHPSAESLVLQRSRILLALAVTPTLVTLVYEWSTGDMPSHAIRAAAGVPIGFIVACLVVAAADNQVN